jgi:hypothetical protein
MVLLAAQAGADRRVAGILGSGGRQQRETVPEIVRLVQPANEIDVRRGHRRLRVSLADHAHQLALHARGRQPVELARKLDEARTQRRSLDLAEEFEIPCARRPVFADRRQCRRHVRLLPRALVERCGEAFQPIDEHPHFGHVALEQAMNRRHLARRRKPIVDEAADVRAKTGVGVAIAHSARDGERMTGKVTGDARIRPPARDVARTAGS